MSKGWTQNAFRSIGISANLIGQYESGRSLPSYENIQRISDVLQVSPSVFFDDHPKEDHHKLLTTLIQEADREETRQAWEFALPCWQAVEAFARCHGLPSHQFTAQIRRGMVLTRLGRWQEAIDALLPMLANRAIPISQDTLFDVLSNLAHCARSLGLYHQAITYLHIQGASLDRSSKSWVKNRINLGSVMMLLGDWSESVSVYREAVQTSETYGYGDLLRWALLGWSSALLNQGVDVGVADSLHRIERLNQEEQNPDLSRRVLHNWMVYARLQGDVMTSKMLFDACQASVGEDPEEICTLWEEGLRIAMQLEDPNLGMAAVHQLTEADIPIPMRRSMDLLIAEYLWQNGHTEDARIYVSRVRLSLQGEKDPWAYRIVALWDKFGERGGNV